MELNNFSFSFFVFLSIPGTRNKPWTRTIKISLEVCISFPICPFLLFFSGRSVWDQTPPGKALCPRSTWRTQSDWAMVYLQNQLLGLPFYPDTSDKTTPLNPFSALLQVWGMEQWPLFQEKRKQMLLFQIMIPQNHWKLRASAFLLYYHNLLFFLELICSWRNT